MVGVVGEPSPSLHCADASTLPRLKSRQRHPAVATAPKPEASRALLRVHLVWTLCLPGLGSGAIFVAYGLDAGRVAALAGWICALVYLALMSKMWSFPSGRRAGLLTVLAVPLQVAAATLLVGDDIWHFLADEYLVEVGGVMLATLSVAGVKAHRQRGDGMGGFAVVVFALLAAAWWFGIGRPLWFDEAHMSPGWLLFNLTALATSAAQHSRLMTPIALAGTTKRKPTAGMPMSEEAVLGWGFAAWAALTAAGALTSWLLSAS